MKYYLLLFFTVVSLGVCTQNVTGYIAFTLVDSLNRQVNPDDYSLEVHAYKTAPGSEVTSLHAPKYDSVNQFYLMQLPPSTFTSVIRVTAENKNDPQSKIYFDLNLHTKFKSPEHFKNLLILRIPVSKDQMQIDMPVEEISWQFIPPVKKIINGVEIEFKDLTFMQNWFY